MKICCLCHRRALGDEPTCAGCGEATWREAPPEPKVVDEPAVFVATDPETLEPVVEAPTKKRTRR